LVVACDASGIGVKGGGSFVEAEFVIGGVDTAAGVLSRLEGLLVEAVVVSLCWLHPLSARATKVLATAIWILPIAFISRTFRWLFLVNFHISLGPDG